MTNGERNYIRALLMLEWSRTIEQHKIGDFDAWLLTQRATDPNS